MFENIENLKVPRDPSLRLKPRSASAQAHLGYTMYLDSDTEGHLNPSVLPAVEVAIRGPRVSRARDDQSRCTADSNVVCTVRALYY